MPHAMFDDAVRATVARGEAPANIDEQLTAARALLAACLADVDHAATVADRAAAASLGAFKRIAFAAAEVAQEGGANAPEFIALIAAVGASFAGGNVSCLPSSDRPSILIAITKALALAADVGVEVNVTADLTEAPAAEAVH